MGIISSIRHRNLLELQGWCYEKGEAMLVYKYMRNGSLDRYLYYGEKRGALESETRLRILAGVALALDYLHTGLWECVLHRDVKAANVLLTEKFEPMLADFGLARLVGHDQGAVTMTAAGTPGYVAPEVVYAGKVTEKADVYGFGVLALEVACCRPALHRATRPEDNIDFRLVDWVWLLHQGNQLMEALDPAMHVEPAQKQHWKCVLHVALMCCSPSPESRPSMRQVSQALHGDTLLIMQPLPATRPLYPTALTSLPSASASSTSGTLATSASQASANSTSTFGYPACLPR
ncbi:hypothetical protein GOP47_0011231 [Adiantum capillus-veneris]|uniref:Protein kinase domain-containing protein n=1 Tax=Adiantum capillus-veneris TaxID=13818 RepID=A0A9D4UTU1_ADICA|nr:hypothetical protein GOP47_0011231 [Adiantum capillus-veneris]